MRHGSLRKRGPRVDDFAVASCALVCPPSLPLQATGAYPPLRAAESMDVMHAVRAAATGRAGGAAGKFSRHPEPRVPRGVSAGPTPPSPTPILFSAFVPCLEVWWGGESKDGAPNIVIQHARPVYRFLAETYGLGGGTDTEKLMVDMIVEECEFMWGAPRAGRLWWG